MRFELQWGRRYSATEISDESTRAITYTHASMGPSLFSDGNWEPRYQRELTRLLQWGRRYSATEIIR